MRALRALAVAVVLALPGLAGCVAQGPGAADQAIIEVPLGDPVAAPEATPTPTPTPTPAPTPTPTPAPTPAPAETTPPPPPEPPLQARARAECTDRGGIFVQRVAGVFACVQPTRDAGRQCRQSSDCESQCLARSQTCAPYAPLFGCNEVLTGPGRRETLCVD